MQRRALIQALECQCDTAKKLCVFENVGQLLDLPNFHGKLFEEFHMCWEIIRRTCIKLRHGQKPSLSHWSVAEYYSCAAFTGDLATCRMAVKIGRASCRERVCHYV